MKLYAMTTSAVFALVTLAHLWRIAFESPALLHDAWFMLLTVVVAALSVWAWRVARRAGTR